MQEIIHIYYTQLIGLQYDKDGDLPLAWRSRSIYPNLLVPTVSHDILTLGFSRLLPLWSEKASHSNVRETTPNKTKEKQINHINK